MEWIRCTDRLPPETGRYLVVECFFGRRQIAVGKFVENLHELDEYAFPTEDRPGWYEYDDEYGFYEATRYSHWAMLPEMPEDE